MPLAREVAAELRAFADALDAQPEILIPQLNLTAWPNGKDLFLNLVKFMPHPFTKKYEDTGARTDSFMVGHETPRLDIQFRIYRSLVCTLIQPAKPAVYDCAPLFSAEEEKALA